ncbi:hypothetical protein [Limnobaculum xujianqingii]|uniref:hypothetical protein n=1 Tax=Limnobaculum xujianqingii TaxID=2738837 RepID=UPI00112C4EEC|nr:hypothetical protein [Limnobaculum xujianqingii]
MKKILLAVVVIVLAGCASSIREVRDGEPFKTYSSSKPSKTVAECVLTGWQENTMRYGNIAIQPYGDGYAVLSGNALELADIISKDSMTKVNFYYQTSLFDSRIKARTDVIEGCL